MDELKRYMEERFLFTFDENTTEDTDLFKAGILDSFGYIELMSHVEETYGVKFSEEDLLNGVMVSFSGIRDFVGSALRQSTGSR
ncbi:acyl carrier protein [Streptomyces sp. NPDC048304]|uniref:acyl carrier protein n=1 Tax=unclassified Streptomyces TaxID=2593676 RepID=UPI0033E0BA53